MMPLFAPDIIIPANRPPVPSNPECELWAAVLEDAIALHQGIDYAHCSGDRSSTKERARYRATAWLSTVDYSPYGFDWACGLLKLDPAWLREQIGVQVRRSLGVAA